MMLAFNRDMQLPNDDVDMLTPCIECGATLALGTSEAFATDDETLLCWACATRRGGVFDAAQDRWVVPPNVGDLPDERRVYR